MDFKPIETRYKGYRFRSRLEARWAVFFDALGIAWEYEKEGYTLADGTKYLPDFWLPEQGWWWEVKGAAPTQAELDKCEGLRDGSGHAVVLVSGTPPDHQIKLFCWDCTASGGGVCEVSVPRLVWSPTYPLLPCIPDDDVYFSQQWDKIIKHLVTDPCGKSLINEFDVELFLPERTKVDEAYEIARSARFEHGENGGR